ncbi:MAG: hypothetical protein CR986_01745 [Ignavibacteriae bacterium]|nr:MAG: hypothetical protein CR986_01745 [Ignavibacteriota bacterium]
MLAILIIFKNYFKIFNMNNSPKRIIYLDVLRAFAVIMMIQGHTVDTFLADEYRTTDSIFYLIWHGMRGFTAPIFMFTSGLVFTYLLKVEKYNFLNNPRIYKGIKRGFLLIAIGYLLRYPTARVFDFTYVSQNQWNIFFTVDALHLIGFGLLTIIFSVFFTKRVRINFNSVLYFFIIGLFLFSPFINKFDWISIFPQFIASYFTKSYGSIFPVFPYLIYVLVGAVLGNYLAKKDEEVYLKKRFTVSLLIIGSILVVLSILFFKFEKTVSEEFKYWFFNNAYILLQIGYVLLLNSLLAFIVRKAKKIPWLIKEIGRKTLLLYVVHVIILYGCAWMPGFYKFYAKSFTVGQTLSAAVIMLAAMITLVYLFNKKKHLKKIKIILNKA